MPGRARAVASGNELVQAVGELGRDLGLEVKQQVRVARRIWGALRNLRSAILRCEVRIPSPLRFIVND